MLNGLDLFSGIGGLTLALSQWVNPVAYCEIDRYARAVLLSRMAAGQLPEAPIWDDVRTLAADMLLPIDIIYGGFPCQDVSLAGLRKGLEGERTGLFREAIRLVSECRPQFVFLENVPGIRRFVPSVRGELEALSYDCRDGFLSAAEVGAPHLRNRWWLLANSNSRSRCAKLGEQQKERAKELDTSCPGNVADASSRGGGQKNSGKCQMERDRSIQTGRDENPSGTRECGSKMADAKSIGSESGTIADTQFGRQGGAIFDGEMWWSTEPDVGRVVDGLPFRVDRLRGLGNAVVPAQAREAFKRLAGIS